jgi:hypothetical protein
MKKSPHKFKPLSMTKSKEKGENVQRRTVSAIAEIIPRKNKSVTKL